MVGIYKGSTKIGNSHIALGGSTLKEVYVGSTKVWPTGKTPADFAPEGWYEVRPETCGGAQPGQSVSIVEDLSGNGRHLQDLGYFRLPVMRQDADGYYLDANGQGTDDTSSRVDFGVVLSGNTWSDQSSTIIYHGNGNASGNEVDQTLFTLRQQSGVTANTIDAKSYFSNFYDVGCNGRLGNIAPTGWNNNILNIGITRTTVEQRWQNGNPNTAWLSWNGGLPVFAAQGFGTQSHSNSNWEIGFSVAALNAQRWRGGMVTRQVISDPDYAELHAYFMSL